MESIIENSIIILDIGAGAGDFSTYCSKINDASNIYAFESSSIMFQLLQKNIKDLGINNVTVLNYAIGHKIAMSKVNKKDEFINIGGLYIKKDDEEVKMITIDSLNLRNCDFIKIDNSEEYVFIGASKTINTFHPAILFNNESSFPFLESLNYKIRKIDNKYLATI
jgi:FkbM family methyltransferase